MSDNIFSNYEMKDCGLAEKNEALLNRLKNPFLPNKEREKIKTKLLKLNSGMVVNLANKYAGLAESYDFVDLQQEGYIGLLSAIDKYDFSFTCKFSSFAFPLIRGAMLRALASKDKTVRLPSDKYFSIAKVKKVRQKLHQVGKDGNIYELAEVLGITPQQVLSLLKNAKPIASIDAPILLSSGEMSSLEELLADNANMQPQESIEQKELLAYARTLLEQSNLTDKEKTIMSYRFGFETDNPETLESVGASFGITKERIRQIQMKSLRKLRLEAQKAITATENFNFKDFSSVESFIPDDLGKNTVLF